MFAREEILCKIGITLCFSNEGFQPAPPPSIVMSWIWIDVGFSFYVRSFLPSCLRPVLCSPRRSGDAGGILSDVFMDSCQYSFSQCL